MYSLLRFIKGAELLLILLAILAFFIACGTEDDFESGEYDDENGMTDSDGSQDSPDEYWDPENYYFITYKGVDDAINTNFSEIHKDYIDKDRIVFELNDPVPKSSWYSFAGWYWDENFTSRCYHLDYSNLKKDITLYAKWEKASYTVSFYATGEMLYAEQFNMNSTAPTPPVIPEREGYTAEWPEFHLEPMNIRLEAIYTPIPYKLTYKNLLGAEFDYEATYTTDAQTVLGEPKRVGYTFLGWTYEGESVPQKKVTIEPGSIGDREFTANWELKKYTLTLDSSGGSLSSESLVVTYGEAFTLPTPEWAGHNFVGWYRGASSISSGIWDIDIDSPVSLIAKWDAISYTIEYFTDGGTNHIANPSSYTADDSALLEAATKPGYSFLGWYDASEKRIDKINYGTVGDLKLYARWTIAHYSIEYKNTFGADISSLRTQYTMFDSDIALPDISVEGCDFNGWLLDGRRVTRIPSGTYGDLTIVADMTPWEYQVVLYTSYGEVLEKTHTVYFGCDYTLPAPSTEGKVFLGWYDNLGNNAVAYTDGSGSSIVPYHKTTSRVLYARFEAEKCTVTYDTDGGNKILPTVVDWGSAFNDGIIPTKDGAVFGGWYNTELSAKYTSSYIIHTDITVKAKWISATPISTAAEFKAISSNPSGKYYLTDNVNLNGEVWETIWDFTGFLDGNGYSVKNFSISKTSITNSVGFFCNNSGTIQNLVFEDFTFNVSATQDSDVSIGIFVGANTGRIYNCVLKSGSAKVSYTRTYTGNISVGGFVGSNSGTVSGCKSYIDLTSTQKGHYTGSEGMTSEEVYTHSRFGGLVGNNKGYIENSSVESTLSYTGSSSGFRKRQMRVYNYVGGLVGYQEGSGRMIDCYASVNITAINSNIYPKNDDSKVYSMSHLRLGGLVGINRGNIKGCYSTGTLNGNTPNDSCIGGLVGTNEGGNIGNCYSKANVKGVTRSNVGGLIGYNGATVQNSFASGLVDGFGSIGGFVGTNSSSATVSKCYSTASVTANSGSTGFFAGVQSGVVLKSYYMKGSLLKVGGSYKNHDVEHSSIQSIERDVLWSDEFLKETLYWDDEGWIILHSENPMLEWEIAIEHDYVTTAVDAGCDTVGYTVYSCIHCNNFFVRDIVAPHGHEKTNFITVPPTCTAQGYNSYYCRVCECSVTEDVVEPLGHTKSRLVSHVDASCTEEGYEIYECHVCNAEGGIRYVIEPHGHDEVTIDAVPSTCQKAGKTEEIFCSVCGDVLKESKTIPPHDLEITVTKTADCQSDGLCNKACRNCEYTETDVVTEALGHADINHDYRCDRCGEISGKYSENEVIEIHSVSDLKSIIKNMNGVYRLMADINLPSDWACIGSEQKPFTGYFDGNGHKITFTQSSVATTLGLFAYNNGIITSLEVVGCNVGIENESCTYGFIAVKNGGYITACRLSGSFKVTATVYLGSDEYATVNKDTYFIFGGIVGINAIDGVVNGCTVDAAITIENKNVAECSAKWSIIDLVRKGGYKNTHVSSMLVINFGGVVGENLGLIEACDVSSTMTCKEEIPEATVKNYYGYASAKTVFYGGSISGSPMGTVRDCTVSVAMKYTDFDKVTSKSKSGKLFGYEYEYRRYRLDVTNTPRP